MASWMIVCFKLWNDSDVQLETPSISYTGALVGVEADRFDLGGDRRYGMMRVCLSVLIEYNDC